MAGSYSTDLRERVLAAMEAGETPEVAARRFAVGRSTAHRWATAARVEGRRVAKRLGGGPKPRISGEVEAALLGLLEEANHLTLAECRDRLAKRTGVRVHPWTGGPGAAAVRLDVKEAQPARGRAGAGGRGRRARRVADGRRGGGGRDRAGAAGVPGRVRRADRHGAPVRPRSARRAGARRRSTRALGPAERAGGARPRGHAGGDERRGGHH